MCCLTPTSVRNMDIYENIYDMNMSYDIPSCTSESLIHSVLCVVISLLIVSCAYVASSIMLIWSTVSVLSVDVSCSLTWWSCQVPRRSTSLRRSYEASVHYQY
uniref:Uncharacterized protein n=1 Tax=Glossina palpalis gambiensis TaxID=67801 RepID=A0A1B0BP88_9MUSC